MSFLEYLRGIVLDKLWIHQEDFQVYWLKLKREFETSNSCN